MLALFNSLNAHNFPIFQPILMILVSKFMVLRSISDKTYLSLGLLSPLKERIRSLWKQIPSFKRRSYFEGGCNRRESLLDPVVSL